MKPTFIALAAALALSTALTPVEPARAADYVVTSPIDAQHLVGQSVRNFNNETIGNVDSVLLDQSGRVVGVVVGVGGFLGLGERDVALDWSALQIADGGRTVRANFTKDQLKSLPEYKFADASQRRTVYYDRSYRPTVVSDRPAVTAPKSAGYSSAAVYGPAGELRTSRLVGASVVNNGGDKIGEIAEILMNPKRELAAVISVGGFLGMGDHNVAIDMKKLKLERRGDASDFRVVLNATKDQLKALPEYRFDNANSLILR